MGKKDWGDFTLTTVSDKKSQCGGSEGEGEGEAHRFTRSVVSRFVSLVKLSATLPA